MGVKQGSGDGGEPKPKEEPRRYEPPRVVWREPYEPMSFGFSCAKQPGNPGCGSGPFTN
jgi:hypothetical protein